MDMFRYARESAVATRIVDGLLGPAGPFVTTSLLSSARGAEVFSVLAEANAERGLECLERTVGTLDTEELRAETANRRHMVWSLERMAIWRPLFMRAARLLQQLALAENEPRIANNATGVFCDLFSLGPGDVAPTEAPPEERFPVLAGMLGSPDPAVRLLGIKACRTGLQHGHFVRTVGAEYQGLRVPPERWRPKTYGEWFAGYRLIWTLLREKLPSLTRDEQEAAAEALLQGAYSLGQVPSLAALVVETLGEIAALGVHRRRLFEDVELVLETLDQFPEAQRDSWQALMQQLSGGDDFAGRLRRYVGMTSWRYHAKHGKDAQENVKALATEALADPPLLDHVWPWLFSPEAENVYTFGYHLGMQDSDGIVWGMLCAVVPTLAPLERVEALGGYLRGMAERNQAAWLAALSWCSAQPALRALLPELVFQSGLTDASADFVTTVIRDGTVQAVALRRFGIGNELQRLSERVVHTWFDLLMTADAAPERVVIALELAHAYYRRGKTERAVPVPRILPILTDARLFVEGRHDGGLLVDEAWRELATCIVQQDESQLLPLATIILDHLGVECAVMEGFGRSGPVTWLSEVAQTHPVDLWQLASKRLGPPIDRRAYHVADWLKGEHFFEERRVNVLDAVPREELWSWIDQDVEKRAGYFATFVAATLQGGSLARDLLIRYGDRKEVKRALMGNFSTEGWSGPASGHYLQKRLGLQALLEKETEPRIREWLREFIGMINRDIEREKVSEEREDF